MNPDSAQSRMCHFNTFPLSSIGTRLLPLKQVEGGSMELPPLGSASHRTVRLFSSRQFHYLGVMSICNSLISNFKTCQQSSNKKNEVEVLKYIEFYFIIIDWKTTVWLKMLSTFIIFMLFFFPLQNTNIAPDFMSACICLLFGQQIKQKINCGVQHQNLNPSSADIKKAAL